MSYKYQEIPIGLAASARTRRYTGSWSIFRPSTDLDTCTKCGLCIIYCPEACIEMKDDGPATDYNYCKGCGICANECPVSAISMVRAEE